MKKFSNPKTPARVRSQIYLLFQGLRGAFSSRRGKREDYARGQRLPLETPWINIPKPGDSEKITINLGYVDLGHIDLMVQEGFYSNRTDFIRTAIRNQLERHADVVKQSTVRKRLDLGLRHYSRQDLEAARAAGEMLHIQVLGLASIAADVTPELARAAIASVVVLGALHASPVVKAALADRMQ
jgi:Arc/MetJ-type ribon-helix-helix transcriptional regulator